MIASWMLVNFCSEFLVSRFASRFPIALKKYFAKSGFEKNPQFLFSITQNNWLIDVPQSINEKVGKHQHDSKVFSVIWEEFFTHYRSTHAEILSQTILFMD